MPYIFELKIAVSSLLGIVLIARPPFIFGILMHHGEKDLRAIVDIYVDNGLTTRQNGCGWLCTRYRSLLNFRGYWLSLL